MAIISFQVNDCMAEAVRLVAAQELTSISAVLRKALDEELRRRGHNWREAPSHACEGADHGTGASQ
jgi:hypothetical protein